MVRGSYSVLGGTPDQKISSAVLDENMDVIFNHHMDTKGVIVLNVDATERPMEYAFLFTNESPGVRVVNFGLHTGELEKSYELPEWDMDKENNLIDRPVAENSGRADEDIEYEGQV